jgi:hypothetical protein
MRDAHDGDIIRRSRRRLPQPAGDSCEVALRAHAEARRRAQHAVEETVAADHRADEQQEEVASHEGLTRRLLARGQHDDRREWTGRGDE